MGFPYRTEAEPYLAGPFWARAVPAPTRLLEFGRWAAPDRRRPDRGQPEPFDCLGRTPTASGPGRAGWDAHRPESGGHPIRRRRGPVDQQKHARWWGRVLHGGLHDYAVPGSFRYLNARVYGVKRRFGGPGADGLKRIVPRGSRWSDGLCFTGRVSASSPVARPTAGRLTSGRSRRPERARPDRCGGAGATRVPPAMVCVPHSRPVRSSGNRVQPGLSATLDCPRRHTLPMLMAKIAYPLGRTQEIQLPSRKHGSGGS